jgi:ubiquitin-protein ligase
MEVSKKRILKEKIMIEKNPSELYTIEILETNKIVLVKGIMIGPVNLYNLKKSETPYKGGIFEYELIFETKSL